MNIIKIHVYLNGEILEIHCKTLCLFKVLRFACANGKGIKKHQIRDQQSVFKLLQNRCGNDAQKSDAKMIEKIVRKWIPKDSPNRETYNNNTLKNKC